MGLVFHQGEGACRRVELQPRRGAREIPVVDGGVDTKDGTVSNGEVQGAEVIRLEVGELRGTQRLRLDLVFGGVGEPLQGAVFRGPKPEVALLCHGPDGCILIRVGSVAAEDDAAAIRQPVRVEVIPVVFPQGHL